MISELRLVTLLYNNSDGALHPTGVWEVLLQGNNYARALSDDKLSSAQVDDYAVQQQ